MVVLGIDPGTANTGYGVVARDGGRLVALDGGTIETRAGLDEGERLAIIHARVGWLLDEYQPDALAVGVLALLGFVAAGALELLRPEALDGGEPRRP